MTHCSPINAGVLAGFQQVNEQEVDRELTKLRIRLNKKIIVLDDDPTGVQTVHDISVYTDWKEGSIRKGFEEPGCLFFILTNSRGMTVQQTTVIHREIARTLLQVSRETGRDFILISRSDSTLRGHYPLETEILRQEIERASDIRFDGEILFPFFLEGGRFTLGNIHYVKEGSQLTPAGMTEFAEDLSFGYKASHLGDWCEEKTKGAYRACDMTYVSLDDLRNRRVDAIVQQLCSVTGFQKVIVNAVDYVDVKVFITAYLKAVETGKCFLFRSAAAVPKVLGGITDIPLLSRDDLVPPDNTNGGIILVGSHVQKTTLQLEELKKSKPPLVFIEFNQHLVLEPGGLESEVRRIAQAEEDEIRKGRTVVVYTRRERFDLDTDNPDRQLEISTQISDAVTSLIGRLTVRPSFILAKGGITSSDVGTKALNVRRARVMGQIRSGVPVWMTGDESKFPDIPFIIFPGNVGGIATLREIVELLV